MLSPNLFGQNDTENEWWLPLDEDGLDNVAGVYRQCTGILV
jgi:hypothetical protein